MAVDTQLTTAPDPTVIYGLIDPRTRECRYVGKSKNAPKRLKEHLGMRALQQQTHLSKWIKSLKNKDLSPNIIILEQTDADNWKEAEIFWVGYMKFLGAKLTNGTSGGEGGDLSAEARKRQADALRGRKRVFSSEHRAKIATVNRARARDKAWLAKIKEAARRRYLRDPDHVLYASKAAIGAPRIAHYQMVCKCCGREFKTTTRKSRYCDRQCGIRAWKAGIRIGYHRCQ